MKTIETVEVCKYLKVKLEEKKIAVKFVNYVIDLIFFKLKQSFSLYFVLAGVPSISASLLNILKLK